MRVVASAEGMFLIKAPRRRALVMVIAGSVSVGSLSIRLRIDARDASLMLAPALLTTSKRALSIALRTPASGVLVPVTSSAEDLERRTETVSIWAAL